ncbi:hypothetical protein F5Y16DRAFT_403964 [Xylariaceae sp. FL0255]|nr:hypothetical protein F5Y16DRAFT_403964 [Xylariaceae sp. FL0255]
MEALQLAQMLADLNDLKASQDQSAAKTLVSANKNLDKKDDPPTRPQHKRSLTEDRLIPPSAARMTDKFGRRIFSPPLSRANSATPSMPGTPRGENAPDSDVEKASTLLSLYEIRAKLREQDSTSLVKAREKIAALAAKQQQQASAAEHKKATPSSHLREHSEPPRINYPGRN